MGFLQNSEAILDFYVNYILLLALKKSLSIKFKLELQNLPNKTSKELNRLLATKHKTSG